ncbi:hypothetical protein AJ79_02274 [Helicocarpus griseus UAMH5409]|uniref:Amine oxidase domain-containing protein n=1 Tax=Helicocarpus griseus UAMH5409 TaxID=1447875 RepID=A0A2B7Y356_9EURO|nr:hypothetical protein AJ79_02274 [Helicocarpus griseus UAMH5409]
MYCGLSILLLVSRAFASPKPLPIGLEIREELDSSLANIHVSYARPVARSHLFTYGPCQSNHANDAHHQITKSSDSEADRLVWLIPDDATSDGCLSAWTDDGNVLLGRSEPLKFRKELNGSWGSQRKRGIDMTNSSGIDASGPWFDGVDALRGKNPVPLRVKEIKEKKIAVLGAGMAGLMTYLNIRDSGFANVELIEASGRLGGRVRTEYLEGGPFDYQYQEMGPMRFPQRIQYAGTNETLEINDHKIVFQLADVLNELNRHDPEKKVLFHPWYQSSPNGLYYYNGIRKPDGTVPTVTEVENDPSLSIPTVADPVLDEATEKINAIMEDKEFLGEMAKNIYRAHKAFIDTGLNNLGGEDWSQFAYMHNYLGYSLNITDQTIGSAGADSFWNNLFENFYFSATEWVTIDGGLSRLPAAFGPIVEKDTKFNREIEKLEYFPEEGGKVKLSWKGNGTYSAYETGMYDYAVVSVPFSVVRRWRLPQFSPTLKSAVNNLDYASACKVALQFSTRFWEHLPQPIFGSCSTTTDIPGIGNVCYPSYNINGTGPGVILASYVPGDWGHRWISMPEEEHVEYVLNAMAEIHGDVVREQYTGKYTRKCWDLDRYTSGSWAHPTIGQHKLFIPSYFQTENNVVFVGEHTSYTHAWISSALESGVRGSVQLLLELGLIDEAKAVNRRWMARWINV